MARPTRTGHVDQRAVAGGAGGSRVRDGFRGNWMRLGTYEFSTGLHLLILSNLQAALVVPSGIEKVCVWQSWAALRGRGPALVGDR